MSLGKARRRQLIDMRAVYRRGQPNRVEARCVDHQIGHNLILIVAPFIPVPFIPVPDAEPNARL